MKNDLVECPCYPICSELGIEMSTWCRYRESEVPPPGMRSFEPKDDWCPSGVQANVLMLGYMLAGGEDPERLRAALEHVRRWARELRADRQGYSPTG
jgi:hypothetical protein